MDSFEFDARQMVIEYWGKRCDKYDETCTVCRMHKLIDDAFTVKTLILKQKQCIADLEAKLDGANKLGKLLVEKHKQLRSLLNKF